MATNPLFPKTATKARICWAGLNEDDFEFYTTYEDSYYCKPNSKYFDYVIKKLNVLPQECLMVGNDTSDDLPAQQVGSDVFLLTDCLINKQNIDITNLPHGGFDDLLSYINSKMKN